MLGDTMRLNFMLRWHPNLYEVRRNGGAFDVYYRTLRHDPVTGNNDDNEVYIGTIRRESMFPWLNRIGRPVFHYTNDAALQNHPALMDARAAVRRYRRASERRAV